MLLKLWIGVSVNYRQLHDSRVLATLASSEVFWLNFVVIRRCLGLFQSCLKLFEDFRNCQNFWPGLPILPAISLAL